MKVDVSRILRSKNSSMEIDGKVDIPSIIYNGEEITINGPVPVSGVILNTGENILVEGKFKADLTLKCSRCLESFQYSMESDFDEELSNKDESNGYVKFEGEIIDLAEVVERNILLSMPMKVLCSDNCKGLCPHCGNNLNESQCNCTGENVDPRLAVLKNLFKDN